MSSQSKNLSDVQLSALGDVTQLRIGVVTADWNEHITHSLEKACLETLKHAGVPEESIHIVHVPGTFELPLGARMLESNVKLDGVVCLGCVIKGETSHNEYINQSVAQGLVQLSIMRSKPFVFGVLTPNSEKQALDRAGGKYGNKGIEAAYTVLKMCALQNQFQEKSKTIGFKKV
jgi:6,7-dimethyl-8-ribityllumazine synthase